MTSRFSESTSATLQLVDRLHDVSARPRVAAGEAPLTAELHVDPLQRSQGVAHPRIGLALASCARPRAT